MRGGDDWAGGGAEKGGTGLGREGEMWGCGAALSRTLTALCRSSREAFMEEISAMRGDEEQHGTGFEGGRAVGREDMLRPSNSCMR